MISHNLEITRFTVQWQTTIYCVWVKMAIFSWFSRDDAIFGAVEGPLKHFQNCWNFVLCNDFPYGNILAGGSWTFQKLIFFGTPYCTQLHSDSPTSKYTVRCRSVIITFSVLQNISASGQAHCV